MKDSPFSYDKKIAECITHYGQHIMDYMNDLDHFQERLQKSLKIPSSYLRPEDNSIDERLLLMM